MTETETIQKIAIAEPIQLNINIPDIGNIGKDGKDGTNGVDGKDGRDGDSAYKIAVKNGFVGTEKEWLASLKGGGSNNNESILDMAKRYGLEPNETSLVNLWTNGFQLKELEKSTSADDESLGEYWTSSTGMIQVSPSEFLLLKNRPSHLLVKRTTDSKMFLVSIPDIFVTFLEEPVSEEFTLEDKSKITITIDRGEYKLPEESSAHIGMCFSVETAGYTVVAGYVRTDNTETRVKSLLKKYNFATDFYTDLETALTVKGYNIYGEIATELADELVASEENVGKSKWVINDTINPKDYILYQQEENKPINCIVVRFTGSNKTVLVTDTLLRRLNQNYSTDNNFIYVYDDGLVNTELDGQYFSDNFKRSIKIYGKNVTYDTVEKNELGEISIVKKQGQAIQLEENYGYVEVLGVYHLTLLDDSPLYPTKLSKESLALSGSVIGTEKANLGKLPNKWNEILIAFKSSKNVGRVVQHKAIYNLIENSLEEYPVNIDNLFVLTIKPNNDIVVSSITDTTVTIDSVYYK